MKIRLTEGNESAQELTLTPITGESASEQPILLPYYGDCYLVKKGLVLIADEIAFRPTKYFLCRTNETTSAAMRLDCSRDRNDGGNLELISSNKQNSDKSQNPHQRMLEKVVLQKGKALPISLSRKWNLFHFNKASNASDVASRSDTSSALTSASSPKRF